MEAAILLAIQECRSDFLTVLLKPVTHIGDFGLIWIMISIICCWTYKYRVAGIKGLGALAFVLLLNNFILKNLVDRERPFHVLEELILLTAEPSGASFPSGHTAGALAAGYIFYKYLPKKYGLPLLVLGLVMGFSRIYVGAHYVTDVLGGIVIGCLCGWLSDKTVDKFISKDQKRKMQ